MEGFVAFVKEDKEKVQRIGCIERKRFGNTGWWVPFKCTVEDAIQAIESCKNQWNEAEVKYEVIHVWVTEKQLCDWLIAGKLSTKDQLKVAGSMGWRFWDDFTLEGINMEWLRYPSEVALEGYVAFDEEHAAQVEKEKCLKIRSFGEPFRYIPFKCTVSDAANALFLYNQSIGTPEKYLVIHVWVTYKQICDWFQEGKLDSREPLQAGSKGWRYFADFCLEGIEFEWLAANVTVI